MNTSRAKGTTKLCFVASARQSGSVAVFLLIVLLPRASAYSPEDDLPPDTSAARATLAQLGPRFGARYTPHFTLLSDADAARTEPLGDLAEQTWLRVNTFAMRLGLATHPPAKKLLVIFFDAWEDYERFLRPDGFVISPNVPGFFDQFANRCVMFNAAGGPLIRDKRRELTESGRESPSSTSRAHLDDAQRRVTDHERLINDTVIRHELAHLVLYNIGVQTAAMRDRRWLQEGLAMQFEAAEPVNSYRAADFLAIDPDKTVALCRSVIADPRPLAPGAQTSTEAYAAAWAIVFYVSSELPREFATYLTTPALPREREISHFEKTFGSVDASFVERSRKTIAAARAAR
ncbi:MAG TPA: DUF1570 domain-containing protein [Phycisphaerae bacterium]|nr:DUF1570 domain-containing protein [Phycisphaerae bacterium]